MEPAVVTQKLNVLVADDESAVRATITFILKRCGHVVDAVSDGAEALEKIHHSPGHYHLLITDHAMRDVSGFELAERLRDGHFPGEIMVASAFLTMHVKQCYRALGVHRFIEKPFDLPELRATVQEIATARGV